ncbi:MAG: nuclear transport factor 2 family protein [Sphingobacteriales bacterium]|jgi:ketosteroid isomerase-like protein|nr:nuclear transport factor 2 family protein [Sphingobacteriales bacterium]MCC7222347.1 nuclear transport factor 2 family protein [Chitinophagales bacterium]
MSHSDTIAALYSAFAQGDVPFILSSVADNFSWTDPSDRAITRQGGTFIGRTGFGSFLQLLNENSQTTHWEVADYTSERDIVVATGKHGVTHRSTGKSCLLDWVMVWRFSDEQLISGRCYYDTARLEAIFAA